MVNAVGVKNLGGPAPPVPLAAPRGCRCLLSEGGTVLTPFEPTDERWDRHARPARTSCLRVTLDQTTANQERELRFVAERRGCEIVKVYKDHGVSGAKGRDKRPQFDALCKAAARREFDVVMAWSVDRLGRSLQDLVAFLGELHAVGIDLFLHQQGLDTTTPAGKAMFQMMGVFAEFERAIIQERVRAGLRRAKHEGKRLGRPRITADLEKAIQEELTRKDRPGVRVIAAAHGVSVNTVQRIAHGR
jgi:DNA invertase Pin-like site-specific DNA recombinase